MGSRCTSGSWNDIPLRELAAFDASLKEERRHVEHLGWLTEGFSPSKVALVRDSVQGRAPIEVILKFCAGGRAEMQQLRAAHDVAPPEFRDAHMVTPGRDFPLSEWWAIFLEIAGGDLNFESIAKYASDSRLTDICATVIRSLLVDWNADLRDFSEKISVQGFLQNVLGERKIAGVTAFADRANIDRDEQWIQRDGWKEWLYNPLALLQGSKNVELDAIVGFSHRDLSVHNILLPTYPDVRASEYRLIDYATFTDRHPLTYDPMYLLVSLATVWLQDISLPSQAGWALIHLLAYHQDDATYKLVENYQEVTRAFFHTGYEWAASTLRAGHRWIPQSLLSLTAAALTFIGRDIPKIDRNVSDDWFFNLAAMAATHYRNKYLSASHAPPPGETREGGKILTGDFRRKSAPRPASISVLVQALTEASFDSPYWADLDVGTSELRAALDIDYEVDPDLRERIMGLLADLHRTLDVMADPLTPSTRRQRASRHAANLRDTLITLLAP